MQFVKRREAVYAKTDEKDQWESRDLLGKMIEGKGKISSDAKIANRALQEIYAQHPQEASALESILQKYESKK